MTYPNTPSAFVVWLEYNQTNTIDAEAAHVAVSRSASCRITTAANCATVDQLFKQVLADTRGEERDRLRAHLEEAFNQFDVWMSLTRRRHAAATADWRKRRHLDGNA